MLRIEFREIAQGLFVQQAGIRARFRAQRASRRFVGALRATIRLLGERLKLVNDIVPRGLTLYRDWETPTI